MVARGYSRRGAVLIVVLGILVVLALLATTFATLQTTEREIARNYLDGVRARLLAQSGLEDAMARLRSIPGRGFDDPAMQFWGNNLSETGAPDWRTPLEAARNPSYALEDEAVQNPTDANVRPRLVSVGRARLGVSATMESSTYARHGDLYRLRVADANSMIHLNDGVENGPEGYVSQNLRRILNNLGDVVGVRSAGDRVLAQRPLTGYRVKGELEVVLGSKDFARLRPFVTTFAWADPNVANPVPIGAEALASYPVRYNEKIGSFRYGRSFSADGKPLATRLLLAPEHADPKGVEHAVMALDELSPCWIEVCRRAPVNVNLAPKEVLTALIVGLRGVFLAERRKHNPAGTMYSFLSHGVYDNTPLGRRGDELGFLYSTAPFVGPGATVAGGGVEASSVADEIVACRTRQRSPGSPDLDYGKLWYGGPFRSWRQFHAFCDGLAEAGILKDERPIFFDCQPAPMGERSATSGPDALMPSRIQARFAARAMADVLKANFNPNLTLNEVNPDANLYTIVDKTDLIANSAEFCFVPMGVFEVESDGLVLRAPGGGDVLAGAPAEIVARQKISCLVKVYDAYRETAQSDFRAGEVADRTLVLGPEPDAGKPAEECRWGGWIQLSPVGGPDGHIGPEMEDALHTHFAGGFDLHHHQGKQAAALFPSAGEFRNNPDRTETRPGPYAPAADGRYRHARAWSEGSPPAKAEATAPVDLRIDGAYVERDSAVLYANGKEVFDLRGTIAYWIKPSFHPEMTGKPRTYFSMDGQAETLTSTGVARMKPRINAHWFFASHDAPSLDPSPAEDLFPRYQIGPWRPACMAAGYSTGGKHGGGRGIESRSLNHGGHPDAGLKPDLFRHHSWIHVAYTWDMVGHVTRLYLNGEPVIPGANDIRVHPSKDVTAEEYLRAPIRLGEPSKTLAVSAKNGRNWAADSTIDEFYMWKGERLDEIQTLWSRGRYAVPRKGKEATFTSREIELKPAGSRSLPPAARRGTTVAEPLSPVEVLGAAWTWYPESTGEKGAPQVTDAQSQSPLQKGEGLDVEVEFRLQVNGTALPAVHKDDGGSPVRDVFLAPGDKLRYRFDVRVPAAGPDAILISTPVIDDVTIFFRSGTEFLSYGVQEVNP